MMQSAQLPKVELLERRAMLSAGALDSSFGTGGKVITTTPNVISLSDIVALPDLRTVAAVNRGTSADSKMRLLRFDANGSPDQTFGDNGVASIDFGSGQVFISRLVLQQDGKIVAVGQQASTDSAFWAIARFNANGSADTTFSGDGILTFPVGGTGGNDFATDALQLSNGELLIAGADDVTSMAIVRLNADGTFDSSFGSGSVGFAAVDGGQGRIALASDGKIVFASVGHKDVKTGTNIVRFTANGAVDTGFSGDGIVFVENFFAGDLFVTSQNRPVILGYDNSGNIIVRVFISGGGGDTTFSPDGSLTYASGADNVLLSDLALQSDGKIIFAGQLSDPGQSADMLIGRLNSDLSLDDSFGTGGLLPTNFNGSDRATSVKVENGRIIAAGDTFTTPTAGDDTGVLARFFTTETSAVLVGSDWIINGTSGADKIRVALVNNVLNVIITGPENFTAAAPDGVGRIVISGGAGNDRITNLDFDGPCIINGNAGNDKIFGGSENDLLIGSNGNDRLDGGLGADTLIGGAGRDTVTYEFRTAPISAGIGDVPGGSGEAEEDDLISNSVETLIGGSGNDRLAGSKLRDVLYGGAGDDILVGNGGDDALFGNDGKDRLIGGAGADVLDGGPGLDRADNDAADQRISIESLLT